MYKFLLPLGFVALLAGCDQPAQNTQNQMSNSMERTAPVVAPEVNPAKPNEMTNAEKSQQGSVSSDQSYTSEPIQGQPKTSQEGTSSESGAADKMETAK
jgi:hypothetical protein